MKIHRYPAKARHEEPQGLTFYGQYAVITDAHEPAWLAPHVRRTYRWLRRSGLGMYCARQALWSMVAEPIVPAHRVRTDNDRPERAA